MSEQSDAKSVNEGRWGQLPLLWLSAVIVALDQWSKYLVVAALPYGESRVIFPLLDLTHLRNTGAAFSFLHGQSGWQRWALSGLALAVSMMLIVWLQRLARDARLLALALALVLGGAVGNLIDRLRLGYVVDFVHAHWGAAYFPAFNVADAAITCGAALLLWDAFFGRKSA